MLELLKWKSTSETGLAEVSYHKPTLVFVVLFFVFVPSHPMIVGQIHLAADDLA